MTFSTWIDLISGAPQQSVLDPIYIQYLISYQYLFKRPFLFLTRYICNFADDTTHFLLFCYYH